jgi:3-oxoacyl-[acyl-carrier protein] reductase
MQNNNGQRLLTGQVAFVTGGSGGIGGAACCAFAQEGAKVIVVDLHKEDAGKIAEKIKKNGGDAMAFGCDVTDYSALQKVYHEAASVYGGIDLVYPCAGVLLQRTTVEESNPDKWKKTVEINLIGVYNTIHAAIPYLKARGGGKIVTMGSGRGRRAGGIADYSCAKAGQWMLVKNLAQELLPYNIVINELVPGAVDTNMNKDPGAKTDKIVSGGPDVMKQPEDVMPLLLFVVSQSNITGPTGQTFSLNRREIT